MPSAYYKFIETKWSCVCELNDPCEKCKPCIWISDSYLYNNVSIMESEINHCWIAFCKDDLDGCRAQIDILMKDASYDTWCIRVSGLSSRHSLFGIAFFLEAHKCAKYILEHLGYNINMYRYLFQMLSENIYNYDCYVNVINMFGKYGCDVSNNVLIKIYGGFRL